jgi:VWFA-related protein
MTRLTIAAVALAVAWAPMSAQTLNQFRARTEGVRVEVQVTSKHAPVLGLTAADFEVRDNGVVQVVDVAGAVDHVAAVLLIDASDSVEGGTTFDLLQHAAEAVALSVGSGDATSVVAFADGTRVLGRGLPDASAIRQAATRIRPVPKSKTAIGDAVVAGASLIAGDSGARLVLVLTDGVDNASWLEAEPIAKAFSRIGIAVDFVLAPYRPRQMKGSRTVDDAPGDYLDPLRQLAARTGGCVFDAGSKDLAADIRARFAELRATYVLTFVPNGVASDDGWHKLDVRLKNKKGDVRARPRYFAGDPKSP